MKSSNKPSFGRKSRWYKRGRTSPGHRRRREPYRGRRGSDITQGVARDTLVQQPRYVWLWTNSTLIFWSCHCVMGSMMRAGWQMGCGGEGEDECECVAETTDKFKNVFEKPMAVVGFRSVGWTGRREHKTRGGLPLVDTQRCASVGVWDPSWACISLGSGVPAPTARGAAGSTKTMGDLVSRTF